MKKYTLFVMFAVFVMSMSCSDDNAVDPAEGTAQVAVKLTDAPGDYESVFVEVQDVQVKMATEGSEENAEAVEDEGWESLGDIESQKINLLELTGGVTKLLSEVELPAGYLQGMRLVLGDNNTVVVDGQELVLNTPSAQQSGLKVQVNQNLEEGRYYTFILDFDVNQSVVSTGDGGYNLHPVIRLAVDENSGSIAGIVTPSTERVLIEAESADGIVSAYANEEGKFQLHGLQEGIYLVTVTPEEGANLEHTVINNVEVKKGEVTELEPIILEETASGTGE